MKVFCYKLVRLAALTVFALTWTAHPAQATLSTSLCDTHRESLSAAGGFTSASRSPGRLSLDIPSRGWLLVEVESLSPTAASAWLAVDEAHCGSQGIGSFVDRSLDHGLLAVEPGVLGLRFGSVVPSAAIVELRLAAHFIPDSAAASAEKGDDTEVGDGEIVPVVTEPGARRFRRSGKDGEEGDDTEVGDGEIVPAPPTAIDDPWWNCLHGSEPFDDFGLCATQLWPDRPLRESLGEAKALDRDYFTFDLDRAAQVRIATRGSIPLRSTLMLENGRTLAIADSSDPASGDFHIEATLVPGTYLIKIEGVDTATGDYEIEWHALPWIDSL